MDSKLRVAFEMPSSPTSLIDENKSSSTPVSGYKMTTNDSHESDWRKEMDDRKRQENLIQTQKKEIEELRQRLVNMDNKNAAQQMGMTDGGNSIALLQVGLIALAALLLGLIFGKLF